VTLLFAAIARAEEDENVGDFGIADAEYVRQTWRSIPFVF
jgi:hypothetical protein